jgi:hypothetical protein
LVVGWLDTARRREGCVWWKGLCDGFVLVRLRTILASLGCESWEGGLGHADARLAICWE